jgi:dsRNA-specific ribonuclease
MSNNKTTMSSYDVKEGIYLGSRGSDFKELIVGLLKRGGLRSKYIKILTDESSMNIYNSAFTSELVDEDNNYQVLEQLGDLTGNKFIVWYMYRRFPHLKCAKGVKVVARLRINYGAKQSFSKISGDLGFWKFISAPYELRQRKMKPLLEDVFEAFLGATESILDDRIRIGVGYAIVYDILQSIFDDMDISLRYEDLYDAKTRLKELFDMYGDKLGSLVYKETKPDDITFCQIFRINGGEYKSETQKKTCGKYILVGEGSASLKSDAQQVASANALKNMEHQGFIKQPPLLYRQIRDGTLNENAVTKEIVIKLCEGNINKQINTRSKSKYQSKYTSTLIASYCRTRCVSGIDFCLELGSDLNIEDSDGMSVFDLLFIGEKNEQLVYNIMEKLLKHINDNDIKISKEVFDTYYIMYTNKYFMKHINIFDIIVK